MVVSKKLKPGEVHPAKGQRRSKLFGACLQKIVDGFTAQYYVAAHPNRLRFDIPTPADRAVTFDIQGYLSRKDNQCNVWIESKGYDKDNHLLRQYREFVVDVALAKIHLAQMADDQFWFVSSAPFATRVGAELTSAPWVRNVLYERAKSDCETFHISEYDKLEKEVGFDAIANSIKILFLTKDLMATTGLKIIPQQGDNLWDMTLDLYPGCQFSGYDVYAQRVKIVNDLASADLIHVREQLSVPLLIWPPGDDDEEAAPDGGGEEGGETRS